MNAKSADRRSAPGDPTPAERRARILRVDHAGEYGARRIYEGQLAVLGKSRSGPVIRKMWQQEAKHLQRFEELLPAERVRPTALFPLWHVAGFALGAASALLGEKAAMACTVAVEEVIEEHYAGQAAQLEADGDSSGLRETVEEFGAEEREHRDTGLAHQAEDAPAYDVLSALVKRGSRAAIWLSERF